MKTLILKSEKDTQKLAKDIASQLQGGEIIALEGDLGAGKTTFTQYLAKELGIKDHVNSPTFVIMKVYDTKKSGISHLAHMDAYRISHPEQLREIGVDEYWNQSSAIVVIEWAEKIREILNLASNVIWMKFTLNPDDSRTIEIKK